MTDELKELLSKVTPGGWCKVFYNGVDDVFYTVDGVGYAFCDADATLIAIAPSLARKVIAAEKLVEAGVRVRDYFTKCGNDDVYATADFNSALTEYEATK